jgi:hypothetical protein
MVTALRGNAEGWRINAGFGAPWSDLNKLVATEIESAGAGEKSPANKPGAW